MSFKDRQVLPAYRSRQPTWLLLFAVLALSPSCLSFEWSRVSRYAPVPAELEASLEVGDSDLERCLARLGAPLWVLEQPVESKDGALLAWGWFESEDFGVRVSYAFDRFVSASFDYEQIDAEMQGIVAVFDESWRLIKLERGLLRDLASDLTQARPRAILPTD